MQLPLVSTVSTGLQSAVVTGLWFPQTQVVLLVSAASMHWSETAELRTDKSRHYDCTIIRMMYNCTIGMMYHIMLYYAGSSLVCQPMHFCHADLRWLARLVLVDDSVLKAI